VKTAAEGRRGFALVWRGSIHVRNFGKKPKCRLLGREKRWQKKKGTNAGAKGCNRATSRDEEKGKNELHSDDEEALSNDLESSALR